MAFLTKDLFIKNIGEGPFMGSNHIVVLVIASQSLEFLKKKKKSNHSVLCLCCLFLEGINFRRMRTSHHCLGRKMSCAFYFIEKPEAPNPAGSGLT